MTCCWIVRKQYGLPNANQILFAMFAAGLWLVALLGYKWSHLSTNIYAGLWGISVDTDSDAFQSFINGSTSLDLSWGSKSVSWKAYCNDQAANYTISLPSGSKFQPLPLDVAQPLCEHTEWSHVPTVARFFAITATVSSLLSLVVAVYLRLSNPTRARSCIIEIVPGIAFLLSSIIGSILLFYWSKRLDGLKHGESFGTAIGATVLSWLLTISLGIRWRWPEVFSTPNELEDAIMNMDREESFREEWLRGANAQKIQSKRTGVEASQI